MKNIIEAISLQEISAAWRGDEPLTGAQITQNYVNELVEGLPRLQYGEGETQTLDLAQLATDFDTIKASNDEATIRQNKEAEIKALGLARIEARIPALNSFDMVGLMAEMLTAGMVTAPAGGSDMDAVKDIYIYARARVQDARTLPISQVELYDPAADSNFPS